MSTDVGSLFNHSFFAEMFPALREIKMRLKTRSSPSLHEGEVKSSRLVPALAAKSSRQNMNKCPTATVGHNTATFKCTNMYLKCSRTHQQPVFYIA